MEINRLLDRDVLSDKNTKTLLKFLALVEVSPGNLFVDLRASFSSMRTSPLNQTLEPLKTEFIEKNYKFIKIFLIAVADSLQNPIGFNEANFISTISWLKEFLDPIDISSPLVFKNNPPENIPPFVLEYLSLPIDKVFEMSGL